MQLYRDWLAGDGKDPAQWLALARKRPRVLLDSDDLDDVYCGVSFLVFPVNRGASPELRDDLPERTVQRLGQILGGTKPVPGNDKHDFRSRGQPFPMSLYQYRGQTLPISPYNWLSYLAAYGPRTRPFATILIRLQNETGLNNCLGLQQMAKIGGPDVMAFYFESLPAINNEVDSIRNDPAAPKEFSLDDPRGWWLNAQQICRAGIERWAGQSFDSDDAHFGWWEANKNKPPEQWLRDSLPITVARTRPRTAPTSSSSGNSSPMPRTAPTNHYAAPPNSPSPTLRPCIPQKVVRGTPNRICLRLRCRRIPSADCICPLNTNPTHHRGPPPHYNRPSFRPAI